MDIRAILDKNCDAIKREITDLLIAHDIDKDALYMGIYVYVYDDGTVDVFDHDHTGNEWLEDRINTLYRICDVPPSHLSHGGWLDEMGSCMTYASWLEMDEDAWEREVRWWLYQEGYLDEDDVNDRVEVDWYDQRKYIIAHDGLSDVFEEMWDNYLRDNCRDDYEDRATWIYNDFLEAHWR